MIGAEETPQCRQKALDQFQTSQTSSCLSNSLRVELLCGSHSPEAMDKICPDEWEIDIVNIGKRSLQTLKDTSQPQTGHLML